MMKKTLLILLMVLLNWLLIAQDSVSVLFIGNSYTYVNDLPTLLATIASSNGDFVSHDSQTPGGATFQVHAGNSVTYQKIQQEAWDFVVLQAQSQEPSFPDVQVNTSTLPFAQQLADSVYANNFCSEVLFFMTWGRENGDPQWQPISTFEGMNTRLRNAYLRMADSVQGSVSPVGSAWRFVRENYPTIQLYSADGSHPSYAGSYLAACTFYSAIFRKTAVGTPFIGTLSAQDALNLQTAASLTVLDSLTVFNLRPITEHTQAIFSTVNNDPTISFENQSTKAQTYSWDFGDGGTSILENPIHTYSANGTYDVTLIAESPCDTDTATFQVTVGLANVNDVIGNSLKIKTLENGVFEVVGTETIERMEVWTSVGQKLNVVSQNKIRLTELPRGIYFVDIYYQGRVIRKKLMR